MVYAYFGGLDADKQAIYELLLEHCDLQYTVTARDSIVSPRAPVHGMRFRTGSALLLAPRRHGSCITVRKRGWPCGSCSLPLMRRTWPSMGSASVMRCPRCRRSPARWQPCFQRNSAPTAVCRSIPSSGRSDAPSTRCRSNGIVRPVWMDLTVTGIFRMS
jgi:hypothetical protein